MPATGVGHSVFPASQPMDAPAQAVGVASNVGAGPSGSWGGVTYLMPVVTVPYANTMGQVNLHCPPSQDIYGKDLPLSADVNTLRYFFNLGVEYFGISANIQQQQQQQQLHQQQQQQQHQQQYSYLTNSPQLSYVYQNGPVESSSLVVYDPKSSTPSTGSPVHLASSPARVQTPRAKPSSSLPSIKPTQTLSSSSQEKEIKDTMELASDVSDSGFTSSGEGDVEQGGEDDLDASIQQDSKPSDDNSVCEQGEERGVKVVKEKGKRKYYMYGTHKLIKPIKDIPSRFQQLLCDMKAAKERCQGQPIYMLEPSVEQRALDQDSGGSLNAEAQCFYPRRPYNVCMAAGPGVFVSTSEVSANNPPPVVPPPTLPNLGSQLLPPPMLPNSGSPNSGTAQAGSMHSSLVSPLPPPSLPPPYGHGPPVGAVSDGKSLPLTSCDSSLSSAVSRKTENASDASIVSGSSMGHLFSATSTSLATVPPPKVHPASGSTAISSAGGEKPRVNYYVYQSQSSPLTPLALHGTNHAHGLPPGHVAYVLNPPTYGPPPSCVTYPPPVAGLPAHASPAPCPPVAVQ